MVTDFVLAVVGIYCLIGAVDMAAWAWQQLPILAVALLLLLYFVPLVYLIRDLKNAPIIDESGGREDDGSTCRDEAGREWQDRQGHDARSLIQQIDGKLVAAAHHRQQLDAIARDFVVLHEYEWNSDEADELVMCVYNGEDYEATLRRIMAFKFGGVIND